MASLKREACWCSASRWTAGLFRGYRYLSLRGRLAQSGRLRVAVAQSWAFASGIPPLTSLALAHILPLGRTLVKQPFVEGLLSLYLTSAHTIEAFVCTSGLFRVHICISPPSDSLPCLSATCSLSSVSHLSVPRTYFPVDNKVILHLFSSRQDLLSPRGVPSWASCLGPEHSQHCVVQCLLHVINQASYCF